LADFAMTQLSHLLTQGDRASADLSVRRLNLKSIGNF